MSLVGALVGLLAVPASGQSSPITFNVKDYSTEVVNVGEKFDFRVTEQGAVPTFEWGVTDGVALGSGKFGVGTVFNKTNASWIFVSGEDNSPTATISGTVPAMAISTSVDLDLTDPGYHTAPYTGGADAGIVIYITVAAKTQGAPKTASPPPCTCTTRKLQGVTDETPCPPQTIDAAHTQSGGGRTRSDGRAAQGHRHESEGPGADEGRS